MKTFQILLLTICITATGIAQNGINYKALVKDSNGNVLASTLVTMQFTIYEGAGLTNNVYQENHTVHTDTNGFVIVNIGEGTTNDDFNAIMWNNDEHFLSVNADFGSGLLDLGTTQFMAVPYALSSGDHPWTKDGNGIHTVNTDVGIGINNPEAQLDVKGGDWNLDAGNPGDFRIGNTTHNFRIGIATGGGGAGITRMYTNSNTLILGSNSTPRLKLNQNGSITAPSLTNSLIENTGDESLITKKYADETYGNNPIVTKEVFIPASSFVPINSYYGLAVYNGIASSSDFSPLFTPIVLPVGATITEISAYIYDDSANNFDFSLQLKNMITNFESSLFSLSTTNGSNNNQILTNTSDIQITSNYSYYVRIGPSSGHEWSGFSGIKGIKIIYTE
ncbi:hypothetical protein [uncultured Psychroserpens sp.]|uniref:hypothetical protein n=1 Tax=uncultured Psychroserpens sp. TaxID=255436 RepID=UPI00260F68DF|nr:hypothetical protein [uncultured Psychroserpens sp.]